MTATALDLPVAAPDPRPAAGSPARRWIWGLLPAFVVHDGEEALVVLHDGGLRTWGTWETPAQVLAAMLLEFTVGWVIVLLATRATRTGWATGAFGVLLAAWTLHGVGHLAGGIVADGYVFGVVTALPAVVVYGVLAFARLKADGLLSWRGILLSLAGGVLAGPLLLVAAHLFGRLVA